MPSGVQAGAQRQHVQRARRGAQAQARTCEDEPREDGPYEVDCAHADGRQAALGARRCRRLAGFAAGGVARGGGGAGADGVRAKVKVHIVHRRGGGGGAAQQVLVARDAGAARAQRAVVPFPIRYAIAVRVSSRRLRGELRCRVCFLDLRRRAARHPGAPAAQQVEECLRER
jgi:hypothetical protein